MEKIIGRKKMPVEFAGETCYLNGIAQMRNKNRTKADLLPKMCRKHLLYDTFLEIGLVLKKSGTFLGLNQFALLHTIKKEKQGSAYIRRKQRPCSKEELIWNVHFHP